MTQRSIKNKVKLSVGKQKLYLMYIYIYVCTAMRVYERLVPCQPRFFERHKNINKYNAKRKDEMRRQSNFFTSMYAIFLYFQLQKCSRNFICKYAYLFDCIICHNNSELHLFMLKIPHRLFFNLSFVPKIFSCFEFLNG